MILLRQKQYGIPGEMAKAGLRAMGRGAAVSAVGKAGMAAGAGTLASAGLLKLGALAAAHPILSGAAVLGGLGYAIHRFLKRRRERKAQERGYSVIERMYSDSEVQERYFAKISLRNYLRQVYRMPSPEALDRLNRIKGLKKAAKSSTSAPRALQMAFSVLAGDIEMPVPKEPREEVPKKIVKKAEKSGVVQKDSNGNWRIINMHGPGGKAIYWKNKFHSKEAGERCLRAYQAGKWDRKK